MFDLVMTKKKKKIEVSEIRIGKPSEKAFETVKKLAEKNDRTIAWTANNIIEQYADQNKQ
jgi:hypothetical protein